MSAISAAAEAGAVETLWPALRRSLWLHRTSPALRWADATWTYDDLAAAVADRARALTAAGVGRGDRVVLVVANGPGYLVTDLALLAVGAVKVPVSAMLSAPEVAAIADRVRPAAAAVSGDTAPLLADLPDLPRLVVDHERAPAAPDAHAALARHPGATPDEPAAIYFSSGTTGAPKGIVHSGRGLLANLWSHVVEAGIGATDVLLLTSPMAHAAGLFAQVGLLRGACVRIEAGFDPARFRDRVEGDGVTWTFAVPTMINRLLDLAEEQDWTPTTLRTVQYGAAPISPTLLRRALGRFGPVLQQLYAQTECPNYATVLSKADHVAALADETLLGSAGRPALMCEVTVRGDDGAALPPGVTGEVCLRSPYTMTGYWEDPQGYRDRFHGRWLRTGDVGYLSAAGYLYLVDRRNDMIVSGGMNVHSIEVEQAVQAVPGVRAAAVIGTPHPDWGEAVHAVVVPDADTDPEALPARVLAEVRQRLAGYKRPKTVELVADLPVTRYGKVDKKALRAPHWAGSTRAIH
ncbi:class I adenylate-forming enzyme family protein [Pseudonocardia sp. WMMC193]|uniref:class I adenylate-forming enzyme family protein n=1 Tax=Pseudonocardia sp. WMMC193 TaxID=2911965 RepID=UPI001F1B4928|nr:AMP-binding protein [Pseudonocardia sp. WMMC193]MCF7553310.1 AMP-binding protein [Pseudonocardia sp. WMMC193]